MTSSMSRKGNCYDNACIESFHSVLKKELVYLHRFKTRDAAKSAIFEYIECFYNRKRVHSSIGYITPMLMNVPSVPRLKYLDSLCPVQSIDRGPW